MAKTRSMTHDDASSRKRIKIFDNCVLRPWSDLNNDALNLVMMRLGVVDFVAFSGVCKSWRSHALSNRKRFMASRPPMKMRISNHPHKRKLYCHLQDFDGRNFKTLLPHSTDGICVGLTCGYLILFGNETNDFWLVNPITRHQLHFPNSPIYVPSVSSLVKAILVFSPSKNEWVFVVSLRFSGRIWLSVAGKRKGGPWNHVSFSSHILDLHAFKGKIYALDTNTHLCELRLDPKPKLASLEIKNVPNVYYFTLELVSSGENIYVIDRSVHNANMVHVLDFGEMKWVVQKEETILEYAFFLSYWRMGAAVKPESWVVQPSLQYKSSNLLRFAPNMWYFPHSCLDVDLINE